MIPLAVRIEEKLFQNRYRVDAGRPHIEIRRPDVCADACTEQACTYICPAGCYTAEPGGRITLATDGCLECGSCRIICVDHHNVEWSYPRGGHGVLFKFG